MNEGSSVPLATPEVAIASTAETTPTGVVPPPTFHAKPLDLDDESTKLVAEHDTTSDLEKGEPEVSAGSGFLLALVFVICGTAQLYYWNALLNMIGDITDAYFPDHSNLSDTLTAVYNTGNLLTAILVTWRGSLSIKLNVVASLGLLVAHILTGICVGSTSGVGGVVFFHLICFFAGCMCGCHQSGAYALASAMPTVLSGWVSTGNGICGIITFGLWMIFSEGPLKGKTLACLWWTMGVGALLLAIATVATIILARREDVAKNLNDKKAQVIAERGDPDKPSYLNLFMQEWTMVVSIFSIFFITLLIYPAIGPFRWDYDTSTESNVILGTFQVGDFIGRSLPQLATWMPFLIFGPKTVYCGVALRLIFLLLFILMWKQDNVAAWSNYGWQIFLMLMMAITNGWFATCCFIHGPSRIKQAAYRGRGGSIMVVGLMLGIVLGLWCAKLVTLGD